MNAKGIDITARLRGTRIGAIFQNATASLNPLLKVGSQILEVLGVHDRSASVEDHFSRMVESLKGLGFADPQRVIESYPHELSGGMRQRAAISVATILAPELVIADECTSALDVTTQAEVVKVLANSVQELGSTLLFITHDLLLASDICDRVIVMYGGQVVESGPTRVVLDSPIHPYTQALLGAVPGFATADSLRGLPGAPIVPRLTDDGCRFASRCIHVEPDCTQGEMPWLEPRLMGHGAKCRLAESVADMLGSKDDSQ